MLVPAGALAFLAAAWLLDRASVRRLLDFLVVDRPPPGAGAEMTTPDAPTPKLSVVMTNFNYARFVGPAIESALAIDYPDVQVIVVDDGSSDGSQAVIARYQPRITALFQDNRGQIAATNRAFALVTGDVVVFLDGDDTLDPALGREIAAVWGPGVSKVQFQMKIIDADGRPTGAVFPLYSGSADASPESAPGPRGPPPIRPRRVRATPTPAGSWSGCSRWRAPRRRPTRIAWPPPPTWATSSPWPGRWRATGSTVATRGRCCPSNPSAWRAN